MQSASEDSWAVYFYAPAGIFGFVKSTQDTSADPFITIDAFIPSERDP